MISIIVAVSDDLGIGKNNDLLWHLPEDMKRFKQLTTGNTVIMGKRTWESLPRRPLPNRKNVVITDIAGETFPGAVTAYSIEDAVEQCSSDREVFIIGGGSIYRQFLDYADKIYLTVVHTTIDGDTTFPELDLTKWNLVSEEFKPKDDKNEYDVTYKILERK